MDYFDHLFVVDCIGVGKDQKRIEKDTRNSPIKQLNLSVCHEPGVVPLRDRNAGDGLLRGDGKSRGAEAGEQQAKLSSRIRIVSKEPTSSSGNHHY